MKAVNIEYTILQQFGTKDPTPNDPLGQLDLYHTLRCKVLWDDKTSTNSELRIDDVDNLIDVKQSSQNKVFKLAQVAKLLKQEKPEVRFKIPENFYGSGNVIRSVDMTQILGDCYSAPSLSNPAAMATSKVTP